MSDVRKEDAARLNHAYLICAPSVEDSLRKAGELAALAVCRKQGDAPCGVCRDCRKAFAGSHPDIITVERQPGEGGKLKREISVDQVRALIRDSVVLPNEAQRKVYIIKEADLMNLQAQNAALKLLEEPPSSVIFLLCAVNAELLLPTVRSRCVEINVPGTYAEADSDSQMAARAFLKLLSGGDRLAIFKFCAKQDMDNQGADGFFAALIAQCVQLLAGRGESALDSSQLMELIELAGQSQDYLRVNVGIKHIFGQLAADAPAARGNRGQKID